MGKIRVLTNKGNVPFGNWGGSQMEWGLAVHVHCTVAIESLLVEPMVDKTDLIKTLGPLNPC